VAADARDKWKGGEIPVFMRAVRPRKVKTEETGGLMRDVFVPDLVTEYVGTFEAVPYGERLALVLDPKESRPRGVKGVSGQLESGLWIDVQVVDGRPQCVGLRGEPEVTPKMLRFPLDRALESLIRTHTVRLELDSEGAVIGFVATSPESPAEQRTVAERTADLPQQYARPRKRGRRPLSDEHLDEVLAVAHNARAQKQPVSTAIAERWNVTPETARQWLHKARKARTGKENDG
jgi:hypothetical protein